MLELCWSSLDGRDCLRLRGSAPKGSVTVRPTLGDAIGQQTMAGTLVHDGADLCFIPRFPPLAGTSYSFFVDSCEVGRLERPRPIEEPTTEVMAIYPTADTVPRNMLRFYVAFSGPMSEGQVKGHVSVVDHTGETLDDALLPFEEELWTADRTRVTLLFDPARIKRGLVANTEMGYPLVAGRSFEVVVVAGFLDAQGRPLRSRASRRYRVGHDERRRVDPGAWRLRRPTRGDMDDLRLDFDRPLDHGLVGRCISVVGPHGRAIDGTTEIGPHERSWAFRPVTPWASGDHRIVVDAVLEDLAGNSVARVFDRDVTRTQDEPFRGESVCLPFRPR